MLLMVEKGISGRICHAIHRHAKAINKVMKNYDKKIESSYLMYLDVNNLYGWEMSPKLPVNRFRWVKKLSKLDEDFIKNYHKNGSKGHILEVDVEYPKYLLNLHGDLPFLGVRKKIKKCDKLACNIHDKENYVAHIRAFNHGLILKKVYRVIQFSQEEWSKPLM